MPRIKHAVFMRFRPDVTAAQADALFQSIAALRDEIPGIVDFSGGAGCSVEGLEHGFTHAFVTTFADKNARDAYLPHPAHERVKAEILAILAGGLTGVCVMDWEEKG